MSFIVFGIYFLIGDSCLCLYSFTQCADFESEVHTTLNASLSLGQCLAYRPGFFTPSILRTRVFFLILIFNAMLL